MKESTAQLITDKFQISHTYIVEDLVYFYAGDPFIVGPTCLKGFYNKTTDRFYWKQFPQSSYTEDEFVRVLNLLSFS